MPAARGLMFWLWFSAQCFPGNGHIWFPTETRLLCDGLHDFPVGGRSVELPGSRRGGCRRCVIAGLVQGRGEERRNLLTLGVPYISVGIGSLIWLFGTVGFVTTLWFLIMVWCVDIGGYVVGCNLKGPKLAPKISPNKTWSGLIGGVVFSVAASVVFSHLFSLHANALFYAVFGGVIAVIAQIGDLVESYIKRSIGIKDSSNLIPGHGGVFDRVDGLIFTAPLVALWFKFGLMLFEVR